MRSGIALLSLCVYLAFAVACNKPPSDNSAGTDNSASAPAADQSSSSTGQGSGKEAAAPKEHAAHRAAEHAEHKEAKREPIVVPAGTAITVSLGSALGSKTSKPGDSFSGSVSQAVNVGGAIAIPQGANISGTVTDAKPLGKLAGGAVLSVRLDSVEVKGVNLPVQASTKSFNQKGKGKRTAVMAGGGAALGGIIGALAGGGKGAAIGAAAGAGAGTGGAAFTGNKDIVLPAESNITFELAQPLEIKE